MRHSSLLLAAFAVITLMTAVMSPAQITINGSGSYADIQSAVTAASPGDVIGIPAGTLVHGSNVNINKANLTIQGVGSSTIIQVSGTGERLTISATGVTIQDLAIEKTDKSGVQNIIYVGASNFTLQNTIIRGQFVIGDGDVSRAMVVTGGLTGILWDNNEIYGLRQPAYVSGTTTGNVTNNYVHRTHPFNLNPS